jgi:trigger factor
MAVEFEVKESKVEDGTLTLEVEVSTQAVAEAYRNVRKELSRYVRIPGFRKGKTPLNVLANHIGKERFQREVERELLPQYYYRAIEETGHRPVSPVTYDEKILSKNKPFVFKAKVAVAPEIELGDYKAAEVDAPEVEAVSDEDVDKRLDELRLQASSPEEKEGAAAEGDLVQFDVTGKVGDQEFPSLTREKVTVRVGDDGYFPGFDKELVGIGAGESKDFSLPAPEDAANPKLAGSEVAFHVEVQAVRSVTLPELDEEFLGKLRGNIQTADDLKARVRVELEQDRRKAAEEAHDLAVQDMLLGLVEARLPRPVQAALLL